MSDALVRLVAERFDAFARRFLDAPGDNFAYSLKIKHTKREAAEFLTLSDRPIIAALVNAVKELSEQNAALVKRIAALEKAKK